MNTAVSIAPSEELFRSMLRAPRVSIPALALLIGLLAALGMSWFFALAGVLPLWAACIINGVVGYGMFTIAHDGTHRALSNVSWLNECLGQIGLTFMLPYAPMPVTRWIHMQHHRFTNAANDPDRFTHDAPWWQIPIRWSNFDFYYLYYFLKHGGKNLQDHLKLTLLYIGVVTAIAVAATWAGYGYEVLMLWLLPTRIALFFVSLVFVFLPHFPGEVSQREDPYMASTMRMGWEWLLTPVLVYHNYHLIHHLYPTVPFYKMHKVWYLKYDELNANNVSVQSAFSMAPHNIELHRNYHKQQGVQA